MHALESCEIQKLSDDTAIVQEKTNLQRDVEVGDDVSIVYEHGKAHVEDSALGHDKLDECKEHERNSRELKDAPSTKGGYQERDNRASFFSARNMVLQQLGKDTKVYDAAKVDTEKGKFTGTVIAISDHHAMQRIGVNTVISHEKADLAGVLSQGAFVQIQYQNGIGSISPMEKQLTRDRDQERGNTAPPRAVCLFPAFFTRRRHWKRARKTSTKPRLLLANRRTCPGCTP